MFAADLNNNSPTLATSFPRNILDAAARIYLGSSVKLVLTIRADFEIRALIIKRVAVAVINHFTVALGKTHNLTVHGDSLPSRRIERSTGWGPSSTPFPLVQPLEVSVINLGHLALGESNRFHIKLNT